MVLEARHSLHQQRFQRFPRFLFGPCHLTEPLLLLRVACFPGAFKSQNRLNPCRSFLGELTCGRGKRELQNLNCDFVVLVVQGAEMHETCVFGLHGYAARGSSQRFGKRHQTSHRLNVVSCENLVNTPIFRVSNKWRNGSQSHSHATCTLGLKRIGNTAKDIYEQMRRAEAAPCEGDIAASLCSCSGRISVGSPFGRFCRPC